MAAGCVRVVGLCWQAVATSVFGAALFGKVESLPSANEPLAVYVVVALTVSVIAFGILLLPYGRDRGRQLHIATRVFGWQAAVGSALAFSFALSTPSDAERSVTFFVGLLLLLPAIFGVVAALIGEAHAHYSRIEQERQRATEMAQLIALLRSLQAASSSAPRPWWHLRGK